MITARLKPFRFRKAYKLLFPRIFSDGSFSSTNTLFVNFSGTKLAAENAEQSSPRATIVALILLKKFEPSVFT